MFAAHAVPSGLAYAAAYPAAPSASGPFPLGIPVLGASALENLFPRVTRLAAPTAEWDFQLFADAAWLIGICTACAEPDLAEQTRQLYARLCSLTAGRHLARVWHYVPRINLPDATGLESYRAFCRGRAEALASALGEAYPAALPAASAVGGPDDQLTVIFAACTTPPLHLENPTQVPAYAYPTDYGPLPPSFARASVVSTSVHTYLFISGTAAIKGHRTQAPGDLAGQIACTVDNLQHMLRAAHATADAHPPTPRDHPAADPARPASWQRHFKVYLRHAEDFAAASALLAVQLLQPGDEVIWLHAALCRADLLIEIEATLIRAA